MIIDRIRSKITRAKQHINDFQLGMSAFFETHPYSVAMKEDVERGKRIYYVTKVDVVPDDLANIAADVIQNLRSPLDNIAYQLVLTEREGAEPEWRVYYPISGSATNYPSTRKRTIKRVRQEIIDAIDATEPYPNGKGHALWQLNELNNINKHVLLIGAAALNAAIDISVDFKQAFQDMGVATPEMSSLFIREARTTPLHVGDELYIEPLDKKVAEKRTFAFEVSLNAPGVITPEPAIKTLHDMANLVDEIVTRLGRLLT